MQNPRLLAEKRCNVEPFAGSNVKVLNELKLRRFQLDEVSIFARFVVRGALVELLNDESQVSLRLRVVREKPLPRPTEGVMPSLETVMRFIAVLHNKLG